MWIVADKTFSLLCRCMPIHLCKRIFFMAVIAKGGNSLRKEFLIRGRMRQMADNTLPLHNGLMDKFIA